MIDGLRTRAVRPRFAIVGEPTSMRIATGHKGKIAARATCCGVTGHSALAPRALNAIYLACDFVDFIRQQQSRIEREGPRDDDYVRLTPRCTSGASMAGQRSTSSRTAVRSTLRSAISQGMTRAHCLTA